MTFKTPRLLVGDQHFWSEFIRTSWGGAPTVFRNVVQRPLLSPEEMFEVLKGCAARALDPSSAEPLRFFGDGYNAQVLEDYARYLPTARDATYRTYARRVERQLGHRDWGIAINNIHRHSPRIWSAAREVAHAVFSRLGLSGAEISAESFIGPYRSTAAGIHKDKFHIFTFPIIGQKTMLAWPFMSVAKWLRSTNHDDLVARNVISPFRLGVPGVAPTVLGAKVGDMIYWPPGSWHVGRGRGDFNATLIFTVRVVSRANEWISRALGESPDELTLGKRSSEHVRHLLRVASQQARRLESPGFAEALRDEFDRQSSACGVHPPVEPMAPPATLQQSDVLEVDARFPILTRRKGDTVECFVNGHKVSLSPAAKTMALLVRRLNRGGRFPVGELCRLARRSLLQEGYDGETTHVLAFLKTCVSLRAVSLMPNP